MNFIRSDVGDEAKLRIAGPLDALTVPDLRPVLDSLVADGVARVTVDLREVPLIDSSAVGALVSLYKRIKAQGGAMLVVGAQEQPMAVFRLLKLEKVFGL